MTSVADASALRAVNFSLIGGKTPFGQPAPAPASYARSEASGQSHIVPQPAAPSAPLASDGLLSLASPAPAAPSRNDDFFSVPGPTRTSAPDIFSAPAPAWSQSNELDIFSASPLAAASAPAPAAHAAFSISPVPASANSSDLFSLLQSPAGQQVLHVCF